MPPRGQNRLYSQAERRLRDTVITFENGNRIEIPEIREVSVEPDGLEATLYVDDSGDILIKNIYAQTATLSAYSSPFMESLNAAWGAIKDDFELADEEEYIATDPISYDELMEGYCGDN